MPLLLSRCVEYQHPGVTTQFLINSNDPVIGMCTLARRGAVVLIVHVGARLLCH